MYLESFSSLPSQTLTNVLSSSNFRLDQRHLLSLNLFLQSEVLLQVYLRLLWLIYQIVCLLSLLGARYKVVGPQFLSSFSWPACSGPEETFLCPGERVVLFTSSIFLCLWLAWCFSRSSGLAHPLACYALGLGHLTLSTRSRPVLLCPMRKYPILSKHRTGVFSVRFRYFQWWIESQYSFFECTG